MAPRRPGMRWLVASVALGVSVPVLAEALGPEVTPFVVVDAPAFVLRRVRVIDGTGGPALDHRTRPEGGPRPGQGRPVPGTS
ncbi:MAG TPA: hypothetical protein VEJ89_14170, partial [Myxococcaceae bacterium]|nr:hypothetical protein [Myxococcaceae bacterium]